MGQDREKHTLSFPLRRLSETDFTSTSTPALVPTATQPSGDGVFDMTRKDIGWTTDGSHTADLLQIHPYGSDAANEDYLLYVFGWQCLKNAAVGDLWVPSMICQLTVTLGSIAATPLGTGMFMADTIALTFGPTALTTVVSPESNLPAYALIDVTGHNLIEFVFDLDAGGAASASGNLLLRGIS